MTGHPEVVMLVLSRIGLRPPTPRSAFEEMAVDSRERWATGRLDKHCTLYYKVLYENATYRHPPSWASLPRRALHGRAGRARATATAIPTGAQRSPTRHVVCGASVDLVDSAARPAADRAGDGLRDFVPQLEPRNGAGAKCAAVARRDSRERGNASRCHDHCGRGGHFSDCRSAHARGLTASWAIGDYGQSPAEEP